MEPRAMIEKLRKGEAVEFPAHAATLDYAASLDKQDSIRHLRHQYVIPTKASLKRKALKAYKSPFLTNGVANGHTNGYTTHGRTNGHPTNGHTNGYTNGDAEQQEEDSTPSIYFCGNSLGVQPKATREYLAAYLETWASIGVNGHFSAPDNSPLVQWQDMAEFCAKQCAPIVGALESEVVIMNTLTANIHFLMASFYKPTEKRHKIICEWKPFPSDYYAIETQIQWHGLDPAKSMVQLQPDADFSIPTAKVLAAIDEHAHDTALLLLPGIQYYSGQLFDMETITKYAQERGIVVGWDLAHAAGNVELRLHDWNVDFAMFCTYKYMNSGPGAIAGAFVHDRHGSVDYSQGPDKPVFRHRLTGWYGGDKSVRFNMDNKFKPTPGAGGFQMSNPSIIDLTSLAASLSVFNQTDIKDLRSKSLLLTAYAEYRLNKILAEEKDTTSEPSFTIITPKNPLERGAQLSVLLKPGLLEGVSAALEAAGIICDKRKPDVIRVAPVPMYNTFQDVANFMTVFEGSIH